MKYLKIIFACFLILALVSSYSSTSYAMSNASTATDELDEQFEGYYLETVIEDVPVSSNNISLSSTTNYVTKTKTTNLKDSNGNVMCSLSITAKFAYDGTTAQCVSYSPKTTVNATYWTAQNLSSINKLSYVSASATFVFSPPFGSELSKDVSLTISCTPDGTVY